MKFSPQIQGFLKKPKKSANNKIYRGRFTCPNVQWTGSPNDLMATFTITVEELADAAANVLLWTDQDVQRGIKPALDPIPPRELSLADGYPDPNKYIFQVDNADDMAEKLLHGEKLFLNPLIWNLRPGAFEGFWNDIEDALHIYSGKIYLPDSHHRHQAIIKAVRLWRSAPKDYPRFKGDREFKIELYFLSRQDEGNYFFDKNQRPKPTEKSKAYDLTTLDDLSLLAKKVIDDSKSLQGNVNRVTDRLIAKNPQVITLSTLREMMKTFAPTETFDTSELEGLASVAAKFYDMLASVRPELGKKEVGERRVIRESLLVDSATMMHGYAAVMKEFNADLGKFGPSRAADMWKRRLQRLKSNISYQYGKWRGDFFEKRNPLWRAVGIAKPGRDGKRLTVLNTGAARSECGRILRSLLAADDTPRDLQFLVSR
jgi:hypothetical protein